MTQLPQPASQARPSFASYPFEAERFPARPLPDPGEPPAQHRVVIVGAGPVGWCAAIGLAQQGVPVLVIEADDSVCFGSRAICISRRSLEILQRLGVAQGFVAEGLAWVGGRSFYRDQQVLHFQMPQDDQQRFPPMVNLAQYSIEQLLLERVQALSPLIEIHWQTRLEALHADADGATLTLRQAQGAYTVRADWVVAADGARSTVREQLGLRLEGTQYEGRYVIVDIRMASERPTERLAYFDPPCNPGSTVLVHRQPHDVWRIDYQLADDEDAEQAVAPEHVIPRVQSLLDMMGETAPWQPIWISLYKANALTLAQYHHGRVLFAGDAAHLVPIFGVRGANSGIDDADNLAWKLGWVVRGLADPQLLASYSAERVAAAHENLAYGTKSTAFMAPPSPAYTMMREAVLSLAVAHPRLSALINPRQTSAIHYRHSPLNQGMDLAQPLLPGATAGRVLPEARIRWQRAATDAPCPAFLTDLLGGCRTLGSDCTVVLDTDATGLAQFASDLYQELKSTVPAPILASQQPWVVRCVTLWPTALSGTAIAGPACGLCLSEPAHAPANLMIRTEWAWADDGKTARQLLGFEPGLPQDRSADNNTTPKIQMVLLRPDGHLAGRWPAVDATTLAQALAHLRSPRTAGSVVADFSL